MSTLQGIQISREGIGHLLADKTLSVPINQRSYAWEDQHVNMLFQDLAGAIAQEGKTREYFLGSVVATQNGGRGPEIVDGQQRLATTSILLAAVRDWFYSTGDKQGAMLLEQGYLLTTDMRTREIIPRLSLNEFDKDYFRRRVLLLSDAPDRRAIKATKDSHEKINAAANIAAKQVRAIVAPYKDADKPSVLMDWVDFIRNNARVIWVTVPDDADAYVIFETLNDRGLSLSISDLLKNYLFGKSGDRIKEVQQRWLRMIGELETVANEDMTVTYIRQLWASIHGVTRERELFAQIKSQIKNKQHTIDFAEQLAENSVLFAALLHADHEVWNPFGTNARKHIRTLRFLKMEQVRTLLLAVLKHFSPKETKKTLRLLVGWSVRFLIAGGSPSKQESQYSASAVKIRKREIADAADLTKSMLNTIPDDEAFENAFSTARVSQAYLARYYLRSMELKAGGDSEPEMLVNDDEESITLEHVLPRNLSGPWGGIDPDTADGLSKRIGNMALLKGSGNVAIDRKEFKEKVAVFKKSAFLLTRQIAEEYKEWGADQINDRQKKLAKIAVKTWPLEL